MLSLLFDARLLLSTPTGIGTYIYSLFPELLTAAPDIHFHLLLSPRVWEGYAVGEWTAPNLTIHTRPWRHMSVQQQWLVPRLASELGVNLIHYPHFDAPVWYGTIPVVATIFDAKYLVRPDFFPRLSTLKRTYMRFAFWATLKRARRVMTMSHATAQDLARLFGVRVNDIRVTYGAADAKIHSASEEAVAAFRQRYGITRPYILSVGELRPHKNFATLIQAYAESDSVTTHDLVIIGRAHGDESNLRTLLQRMTLENRVHILTDVEHDPLRAAYTGARVLVLVSLYEGFGLPVLEAMACGVPVIGSNTTSMAEVIGDGGIQVDPTNLAAIRKEIDRITASSALRETWAARGAAWQRGWTWQRSAVETIKAYREVLGR